MWSVLATLGAAVWPFLKWVVPWAGPRFNVILAVLVAVGGLFLWDHVTDQREINAAVRARDAEWQQKFERANERYERKIEAARDAADSTPPIPDTPDALERLCQESPTCRDRAR